MQIIDAQIHLWTEGTVVPPHRTSPYLADEALADMDAAGVTGAVIHPPSWDPHSNALAIAAAKAHPERFAILGRIPLAMEIRVASDVGQPPAASDGPQGEAFARIADRLGAWLDSA